MESETHKNLTYQAGNILRRYGWNYTYTTGGVSDVDIIANKNFKEWKVEIEYSGGEPNIRADLENGAHIFVAPVDRLAAIERIVRMLGSTAPVVTIGGFERHAREY